MDIKVMLTDGGHMPTKAHEDDAGWDLYALEPARIRPGRAAVFHTGVHIELPHGTVGLIMSRSGLNINNGLQCEGVIDSGYCGEIRVKLYNHGRHKVDILAGQRIAQLLIMPLTAATLVDSYSITGGDRGNNGFGSSGK